MSSTDKALALFAAIVVALVLLTLGIAALTAGNSHPTSAVPVSVYTCTGKCELLV